MKLLRPPVLAAAGLSAYMGLVRPRLNAWGTTPEEASESYPGHELIPDASARSAMATTIAAPPSTVWAWLVQMGCDRAGFYSWDRLDNGGRPSAERIHSEWQDLKQGNRVISAPDGGVWFDVALLEPERALVLRASLGLPKPRPFDVTKKPPRAFSDSTWGFFLSAADDGGTRLVVHTAGRGRPRGALQLLNILFWEPAHWVMQAKQFAGLRRRAESQEKVRVDRPRIADFFKLLRDRGDWI